METKGLKNNKKYYSVNIRQVREREILVEAESKEQAEQRVLAMYCDNLDIDDNYQTELGFWGWFKPFTREEFISEEGFGSVETYEDYETDNEWEYRSA